MNLGEKILLGWLATAWLIRVVLGWKQRHVSPYWAWTRIASGVILLLGLELLIWHPQTPYLDYIFYVGMVALGASTFAKRKMPTPSETVAQAQIHSTQ